MSKIEVNTVEPQCGTNLTIGASGDTITFPSGTTVVNNGSQTGFGRTGTVDWQTGSIKTATFTAVSGQGFFCNTAGGAFEVDLPAGSAGAIVSVQDYNNTFDTHNLTIDPNGSEKINGGGAGDPVILSTEGQGVTFVYIDATVGWRSVQDNVFAEVGSSFISATGGTITNTPTCRIHTFTGPGTFQVTAAAACAANNAVGYLVVAGGGGGSGGASGDGGGGGGAGGFREGRNNPITPYTASPLVSSGHTVSVQSYPITVGAAGTGTSTYRVVGGSGGTSTFSSFTSAGGGGGGANTTAAASGGSGGGGGAGGSGPHGGAAGNTPPVSPPQGNQGGTGGTNGTPGTDQRGGGGGGATAAGQNSQPSDKGGDGGAGGTTHITGSPVAYAGGGGGMSGPGNSSADGAGGTGGGGAGASGCSQAVAGTANTGGGGGGAGNPSAPSPSTIGANGGSGIVIIRYKIA
jgi:hypothetical protein